MPRLFGKFEVLLACTAILATIPTLLLLRPRPAPQKNLIPTADCSSLPNNWQDYENNTGRRTLSLSKEIYPYEKIKFDFHGATAGIISNGEFAFSTEPSAISGPCWYHYYEFDLDDSSQNGYVDIFVPSSDPGQSDYHARINVLKYGDPHPAPSPLPYNNISWQTYLNTDFGYTIKYPSGWEVREAKPRIGNNPEWTGDVLLPENNEVQKVTFIESNPGIFQNSFEIKVLSNPKNLNLDQWVNNYKIPLAADPNINLASVIGTATLSGRPAKLISINQLMVPKITGLVSLLNNRILFVSYPDWDAYAGTPQGNEILFENQVASAPAILREMVSSFTFLPTSPTCRPRPACLDSTPRCLIPETPDMCPPKPTPVTTRTFCGGIAGIVCPAGFTCQLDGSYPDAGGTCVKSISPTSVPLPTSGSGCIIGGCSGEICQDEKDPPRMTPCMYQTEYNCLGFSRCEHQPDGRCGWTQTPDYLSCLRNPSL